MAGLAAIASKPSFMKTTLLTQTKNNAGIIGVKFYIRSIPWVISIDDQLLMTDNDSNENIPVFANFDTQDNALWGPLYEKAWSKVKGSYDLATAGWF